MIDRKRGRVVAGKVDSRDGGKGLRASAESQRIGAGGLAPAFSISGICGSLQGCLRLLE
jgi:hypothetical protein